MFYTLYFIIFINLILLIAVKLIPLINIHKMLDREKMSPFECGFDPLMNPRVSFSIHFFSVGLMFLIFDIEITLILPIPLIKMHLKFMHWILFSFVMMTILIIGLAFEWKQGSMDWK